MTRLLILVEGETEETFVKEILAPHLYDRGFHSVSARLMGNVRQRDRRGGIRGWPSVRQDIIRYLKQDTSGYVSLMVDYYGLPGGTNNPNAWLGRSAANQLKFSQKAQYIETALRDDIANCPDLLGAITRFIPYIMMHEFEALLFSDCQILGHSIGRDDLVSDLIKIRNSYHSPEEINDGVETHPSKCIQTLMPEYEKPLYGNLAIVDIGLSKIRSACSGFDRWLEQLELLL